MKTYLLKSILIFSPLIFCSKQTKAQDSTSYILNEFSFSVNNTLTNNAKFEKLIGYNLSIRHIFKEQKQLSPIIGAGFKITKKFVDQNDGGSLRLNNTYINDYWFSLNLGLRYIPNKIKSLFFEIGISIEPWMGGQFDSDGYLNSPIHGGYQGPVTYKNEKIEGYGINFPIQFNLGYIFQLKNNSLLLFDGYCFATRETQQNFYHLDYAFKNNYLQLGLAFHLSN